MNFNSNDLKLLDDYLRTNKISKNDICLVGSTTLSLIGIRECNDIDIIIHSNFRNELSLHHKIERVNSPWSLLFSDNELIKNSELHITFSGFKFVIPELIYHKKSWHNRSKDKTDIIDLDDYAKFNDWNWDLISKHLPKPSRFKIIVSKIRGQAYKTNFFSRRFNKTNLLHKDCIQMIPTNLLLSKQIVDDKFNRLDIIVRIMALESHSNNDNYGINLYKRMQLARGASSYKDPWNIFKKLMLSIKNNSFDYNSPILVNNNLHLVDGAHRLACALFYNEILVPIKIKNNYPVSPYSYDWFRLNNFNKKDLSDIGNKKLEIFNNNCIYFEVVLWPSVYKYFDEIEQKISNKFEILSSINYSNINQFSSYVRSLYRIDDIKDWKVEMKINALSSYDKNIRIIRIELPSPDFRRKSNGSLISSVVEKLKSDIRSEYSRKIENYIYDIIIHIGDNYTHSKKSSLINIDV